MLENLSDSVPKHAGYAPLVTEVREVTLCLPNTQIITHLNSRRLTRYPHIRNTNNPFLAGTNISRTSEQAERKPIKYEYEFSGHTAG